MLVAVGGELKVDCKQIEQDIEANGFAFIHCSEYKTRCEIRTRLAVRDSRWIYKTMVNKALSGNSIFKCLHCAKCSPDHTAKYTHFKSESGSGPDSSMTTCPKCNEVSHREGDDDFVLYFPDKNVLVVALEWKGKKYYRKQFKTATFVSSV